MKRFCLWGVVLLFSVVLVHPVSALTIDGNLDDWGITPFVDWELTLSGPDIAFNCSAAYVEHDNIIGVGARHENDPGGDPGWDIEWGGLVATNEGLYFSLVTSRPQLDGYGDLAISVGDAVNDTGADKYQYGVDLTYFPADGTVQQRDFYDVDEWRTQHGKDYPNNPHKIISGDLLGQVSVAQSYLGTIETGDVGLTGAGNTYFIEGFVPYALLGFADCEGPACATLFEMHYAKVSCLRDWISVRTSTCCEIPEPASALLLGLGLLGLHRRKKTALAA